MAVDRIKLRENINRYFSLDEIESLCFDLGVDFENIGGSSKPGKVLELIQYMERRGRLDELAQACNKSRPNVDWGVGAAVTQTGQSDNGARQVRSDDTEEVDEIGPIRNRYALVVGIDKFTDPAFAELKFCVSDAKALSNRLTSLGYMVVTMTDDLDPRNARFPSYFNIEAELNRIVTTAERNDMLLVHFSCHGTLLNQQPYLIVSDSRQFNLTKTSFSVEGIEEQLKTSKAKRRVIFLDACHVGAGLGRSNADPAFIRNVHELAWGSSMLAASTSEQVALEMDKQPHGAFTYFLLEGLNGSAKLAEGFVTVDSLKNFVLNAVKNWSYTSNVPVQQPTFRGEGLGDMILADFRTT